MYHSLSKHKNPNSLKLQLKLIMLYLIGTCRIMNQKKKGFHTNQILFQYKILYKIKTSMINKTNSFYHYN